MTRITNEDIAKQIGVLTEKTDDINRRLDKINGSVQETYKWKCENHDLPDKVKTMVSEVDRLDKRTWKTGTIIGIVAATLSFIGGAVGRDLINFIMLVFKK